ncbi:hypothetical protein ACROYT_G014493 [Oculina patagonica]
MKSCGNKRPLDFLTKSNIIETAPNCACRFIAVLFLSSNEGDDGTLSGVLLLPKTPDYRPVQDDYDLMEHSGIDDQDEASPPPSQPRRVRIERAERPIPARKPEKSEKKENNLPERKREEKRGSKRKYVDQRSVEAKIAKTEESIYKIQRHLHNRTCPKSLQYAARANITPDGDFQKEVRDIKHNAEQAFVNAFARFHKRRLENHKKKHKAGPTGLTHRSTVVHRQSRIESQSAQSIVNTTDVKIAELEKKITDLTDIVSEHKMDDYYDEVQIDVSISKTNQLLLLAQLGGFAGFST